jgi:Leucine-rich repeat (LRR) protein
LTALNAKVTSSSPVTQIALAALANLRNSASSSQATTQLNALASQQASDGSWGEDPYATALALRALAAGLGKDVTAQKQAVGMPDATLRAVVNANLGHGAMDAITVGECQQLTTLNASGLGIKDLTGLGCATNLTNLDVSNNQIQSFTPIAALTKTAVNETGNPGYVAVANDSADSPTLPEWGAIVMGGLLLLTMVRAQQRQV